MVANERWWHQEVPLYVTNNEFSLKENGVNLANVNVSRSMFEHWQMCFLMWVSAKIVIHAVLYRQCCWHTPEKTENLSYQKKSPTLPLSVTGDSWELGQ